MEHGPKPNRAESGDETRNRRLLGFLALFALMALAGCQASLNPNVCGFCNDAVESEAIDADGITHTEMDLAVRSDGDARVRVEMRLTERMARELRTNQSRFERFARTVREAARNPLAEVTPDPTGYGGGMGGSAAPDGTPRPVAPARDGESATVTLDGNRLVVTYESAAFAQRTVGVVVVDRFYFHDERAPGNPESTRVNVDRFRLRAADGAITVFEGNGTGRRHNASVVQWTGGEISPHTQVVIAPRGGPIGTIQSRLAIALLTVQWALPTGAVGAAVVILLFAVTLLDFRRRQASTSDEQITMTDLQRVAAGGGSDGTASRDEGEKVDRNRTESKDTVRPRARFAEWPDLRPTLAVVGAIALFGLVVASETAAAHPLAKASVVALGFVAIGVRPGLARMRAEGYPGRWRLALASVLFASVPVVTVATALVAGGGESMSVSVSVAIWGATVVVLGDAITLLSN